MRKLAETCIARPVFAFMLILALVVVGATAYMKLGVDRFPSVDLPTVTIRTSLRGAAPEEMETQVSQVIEEAVNTVDGIDELRSISSPGNSYIIATFRLDRNVDSAAQDIRDRVATVLKELPKEADPPIISKVENDSRPVITIALSGQRSNRELSEIADKVVKRQLERAKGVGQIDVIGDRERSINIWIDSTKLAAYGIPITNIRNAVVAQNAEVPGGRITDPVRERQLRTLGRIDNPADFNDIAIATVNGNPIRLRDVARVEDGSKEERTAARLNGRPTVTLEITRQSGTNSIEVIEALKREMAKLQHQLPPGVEMEVIEDQSRYIYSALHEIQVHLVLGSILACLIVLLFMRNWRSMVIAGAAIPSSVIATFGMMWALKFTLNSVTMLALVLMVGIVIDDAIVVLENIFRFVEEKRMTPMEAAKKGTAEIALAVLATTLSLVVIFIPVSFMSSISGRFLYQFGMTAAVAVMVSLLVSFTLTPMLAARALKTEKLADAHHASSRGGFYSMIDASYTWMLKFVMRHRLATGTLLILVILSSIPIYQMVKQDYLPSDVDEGEFTINVMGREGTSFTAMDALMKSIEADLQAMPEIQTVLATTGGGMMSTVNSGRVYIRLQPHESRYFSLGRLWHETMSGHPGHALEGNYTQLDVMQKIRAKLRKYRDVRIQVRNMVAFNIGGGSYDIDFMIRGPELEKLFEYTNSLRDMTLDGRLPGIVDADTTLKLDSPEVRIAIDRRRAEDLGVNMRDVGDALRLLVGGDEEICRYRDPETNENYDVQLRLEEKDRNNANQLPMMLLPRAGNQPPVELRSIARAVDAKSPSRIDRLNRQRAANVRGAAGPGYALADRLEALRKAADTLNMPSSYSVTIGGKGRELERTFVEFIWAFMLSIIFMYMILASNYESLVHPVTILVSLPVAVPFALFSLWASGGTLNLYSALGILVLFGVVKKNAILQIDHTNQLREKGMSRYDAIIQGNRDRLRPILMTTLCLVAGMLPLALGSGPGAQERRAVAIVVIGGQTLALLLTLLATPVVYSILDDIQAKLFPGRKTHTAPTSSETPELVH